MAKVSFGIGGYGGRQRHYIATVKADASKINVLSEALQDVGFWTVVSTEGGVKEPTLIEVGEVILQYSS